MSAAELDLTALRATANSEPSHKWGKWTEEEDDWDGFVVFADDGQPGQTIVAKGIHQGSTEGEATADFMVTFDPPTVLALLDRLEAAEGTIARVRALCMDTDGNYLDPEDECNNVGGILQALGGE